MNSGGLPVLVDLHACGVTKPVTISSATAGVSIRYTTDGSTPSSTQGTLYTGALTIAASTPLKAIAYKSGMADSSVSSAVYIIDPTPPSIPADLAVSASSPTEIDLTWSPSTDNVDVDSYVIYRNNAQIGRSTWSTPSPIPARRFTASALPSMAIPI